MKTKLLFTLILIFYSVSYSQYNLKGTVSDSQNGKGIEGVNIFLSNEYFSTSNRNGEFFINDLPAQSYSIKASHLNYESKQIEVIINGAPINIKLNPSSINLDEVIVTSSKHEQYIKNLPYSALLVDKSQIQSNVLPSVADILKSEPGVSLVRDGIWATDVSIRGLNRSNIVTLIDGIRLETANDLAARLSMIDLNDIDRIEIIKGASSSLYGSGATGGVVNVITRSVGFEENMFMNGSLSGGYNSVNNSTAFSGMLNGGGSFWTSKISGSLRKADDVKTPAGTLPNSRFSDYSLSGTLTVSPLERNFFRINYQLFNAKDVGVPGGYPLFPDKADVRYPTGKRELISAQYEVRNLSSLINKISLKYSYQYILRDVENIPHQVQSVPAQNGQPARRVNVLKITPTADHITNNVQLQTDFILSRTNYLLAGIDVWKRNYEGSREKYQRIDVLGADGTTVVKSINKIISEKPLPNSGYQSIGFFVQDEFQAIPEKLQISLGTRLDHITINGDKTLNPIYEIADGVINYAPANQVVIWDETNSKELSYSGNLGLLYSLLNSMDLTLNAGYSFRSPSLEERFQYIDQGNLIRLGNPDLKSERGNFFDIGMRYRLSGLRLSGSLFMNYLRDLVVEEPGKYEGRDARIKTNVGEARLYGFDASFDYNFYSGLVAYGNLAYVRGQDIKGNTDLPQISPLNGLAGIKFPVFPNLNLDFSSVFYLKQDKIAPGEIGTPGYVYFNAMISFTSIGISNTRVQFFAGVDNILNKNYRNHLSTNRGSITIEPGRNIYFKTIVNL